MAMNKLLIISALVLIVCSLTCGATLYMVGDTSGWDISTNLETWVKDKRFLVGDDLRKYFFDHQIISLLESSGLNF